MCCVFVCVCIGVLLCSLEVFGLFYFGVCSFSRFWSGCASVGGLSGLCVSVVVLVFILYFVELSRSKGCKYNLF